MTIEYWKLHNIFDSQILVTWFLLKIYCIGEYIDISFLKFFMSSKLSKCFVTEYTKFSE